MKRFDVFCTDQPMIDITVEATEDDIVSLAIPKGTGVLIDNDKRREILDRFKGRIKTRGVGGSGLNTIKTLAAFGKKTVFVGVVGDDKDGSFIRKTLKQLKVAGELSVRDDYPTGACICMITPDGERTMAADLGKSRIPQQANIITDYIAQSRIFHFCGYIWDGLAERDVLKQAIAVGKKHRTAISFDVSDPLVVKNNRRDFIDLIRHHTDIVFANEEEAKSLFDNLSPQEAAFSIQALNKCAVIKLGSKGALIGNRDDQFKIAPIKTVVRDTTGAGDMFAAGFLYGITADLPLPIAGYYGALLSTDVIKHYGAVLSEDIYRQLKEKRHFAYY